MNRRDFIKNALIAGVGAGLIAKVPLIDPRPPATSLWTSRDDIAFANYLINTRIMPKYRAAWMGDARVYYHNKRGELRFENGGGRNLIRRQIRRYLDSLGPERVSIFERIITAEKPIVG